MRARSDNDVCGCEKQMTRIGTDAARWTNNVAKIYSNILNRYNKFRAYLETNLSIKYNNREIYKSVRMRCYTDEQRCALIKMFIWPHKDYV